MNRSRGAAWLALALGLAAAGGTAHAAVIYNSAPGFNLPLGSGVEIPLAGNSGPGGVRASAVGGEEDEYSSSASFAGVGSYPAGVTVASLDNLIGSSTTGWTDFVGLSNGTSYFGISFNNGGTTNYGWMQVSASGFGDYDSDQSFTVNAYAYDNTGASINVGATSAVTSAVPEPSSQLALIALGSAGVLTRRRQKRAA